MNIMTIYTGINKVKIVLTVLFIMIISQSFGNTFSSNKYFKNMIVDDSIQIEIVAFHLIEPAEGIAFYKDEVLIYSNSKYQHKMIPEHVSFGLNGTYLVKSDNFESHLNSLFISGDHFPFDPARMTFSPDYKTLYYSGKNIEGSGVTEKIYSVPLMDSNPPWQVSFNKSSVEVLPFCTDDYTYRHPAISDDNSFMVYASNNEESIGRFDLFMVSHDGDSWGEAINLGNLINSDNDELYPFLDSDNNLFFSSNGHSGLGGFDIFMCKYSDEGWGSPVNLMNAINSKGDELSLKIHQENQVAYYTVLNRTRGNDRQLLRIKFNEGNFSDNLHLIAQNRGVIGNDDSLVDRAEKKEPKPIHKAPKESKKEQKAASKKKAEEPTTTKEEELTRTESSSNKEALLAKKAEEETLQVKKDKEEALQAKKAEEEALLKKKAEEETLLAKKAEEEALLTKKAEEEALLTKKAEEEALREKKTEEEAMLAKKAEEKAEKNIPFFRVQITSSSKAKSNYRVDISGKTYPTFEYYYVGAYRYTVGNFRTVAEAIAFKNKCRESGFSQAFVAAFINDVRETDPAVFKR